MKRFVADFHVHTLLSPCAGVEMTPRNIILNALECGIDIVAITDHNACDNVAAALKAAEGRNVTVIPGMEVESKEEVHLLTLFSNLVQLKQWEAFVMEHRSGLANDERKFGAQFIVDELDEFIAVKPEMLLASLSCSVSQVATRVAELGGICIASHIDRPAYSILSQLGFIPDEIPLTAVEVTGRVKAKEAHSRYLGLRNLPVISSSDAHSMEAFITGPKMVLYIEEPTIEEIQKALAGLDSRKAVVTSRWQGTSM